MNTKAAQMNHKLSKKNDRVFKITQIAKKLSISEFTDFIDSIKLSFDKSELDEIKNNYALRNHDLRITKSNSDKKLVEILYKDEITKIERLITREDVLEKIGGLKVLIHGKTGTGKTTFAKIIGERNHNYLFEFIDLETIVSSKMGQTQINILRFADEINEKSLKSKIILFFDELDSVVGNRASEDLGERKKIASTFIKMIDKLNKNVVVFAATNFVDGIDEAILRRFNFQIKSKPISMEQFIEFFDKETNSTLSRKKTFLIESVNKELTISDLNNFVNHFNVEKEFSPKIEAFPEFIKFFKGYVKNEEKISGRVLKELSKENK